MDDLISRKELLTVRNVRKVTEFDETGEGITYIAVPVDAIEKAPTIEAEPVRHGEWELIADCANEGVYCSNCHKKVYNADYANQKLKSKFCPNCGAKMDGGKSE